MSAPAPGATHARRRPLDLPDPLVETRTSGLVPLVLVRAGALVLVILLSSLLAQLDDSPDANIDPGLRLLGAPLLVMAV